MSFVLALSKHTKYLVCLFLCFSLINNFLIKTISSKFSINTLKTLIVKMHLVTSPSVKFWIWFDSLLCAFYSIYVTSCTRNDKVDLKSVEHTNIFHEPREIFAYLLAFHFLFINICICTVILNFILNATIWVVYVKSIHKNNKKRIFKYHDNSKWFKSLHNLNVLKIRDTAAQTFT